MADANVGECPIDTSQAQDGSCRWLRYKFMETKDPADLGMRVQESIELDISA